MSMMCETIVEESRDFILDEYRNVRGDRRIVTKDGFGVVSVESLSLQTLLNLWVSSIL